MRKIREVLRLHSLGLKQRQIARSCSVGQSTVSEYIKAADAAGLRWPDIADWDEAKITGHTHARRSGGAGAKSPSSAGFPIDSRGVATA